MVLISTNKTNFFLLHLLIDNSNREHLTQIDIFQKKNYLQQPSSSCKHVFNVFHNLLEVREKLSWFWLQTLFKGRETLLLLFSKKKVIAFCVIFIFAICRNLYNLYFSVEQTWSVVTNCTRKKSKKVKAAIIRIFYFLLMDEDFRACKRVFSEVF